MSTFLGHGILRDVDPDTYAPKYRRVANVLRERIRAGQYPAGGLIPAEPQLMAEFRLDRGTVRRGLAVLRHEGLSDPQPGRGTYVRERRRIRRNLPNGLRLEYNLAVAGQEPPEGIYRAITGETSDVQVITDPAG